MAALAGMAAAGRSRLNPPPRTTTTVRLKDSLTCHFSQAPHMMLRRMSINAMEQTSFSPPLDRLAPPPVRLPLPLLPLQAHRLLLDRPAAATALVR
jgi:hypothetical protein